jgi:hypothetical protein
MEKLLVLLLLSLHAVVAFAQPQQGDTWSRIPVTSSMIAENGDVFRSLVSSTVHVNGATGFYLGVFAGLPVLITARHVMPDQASCTGRDVVFYADETEGSALEEKHFTCDRLLGAWDGVEISLFTLAPSAGADAGFLTGFLDGKGLPLGLDAQISPFEMLETMGHGGEQNPLGLLTADLGSDCYVANATDDFRYRDNQTWSMALGCNESAGDSGSPVVERATGLVLGMVWGGHTDKEDALAKSAYLRQIVQSNSPEIWEQLNYAIPMPVIGAFFRYILKSQTLDPILTQVLNGILGKADPQPSMGLRNEAAVLAWLYDIAKVINESAVK